MVYLLRMLKRRTKSMWTIVILTFINMVFLIRMTMRNLPDDNMTNDDSKTLKKTVHLEPCPQPAMISENFVQNRNKVGSYPLGDSIKYLSKLGLQDFDHVSSYLGDPVVITAASSSHFTSVDGLVQRLISNMKPKLKIIVYDLSLTETQRRQICQDGNCVLKKFPYSDYPAFVKEQKHTMAWKPVLIQLALQEFGFVIWMDSAIYLPDGNLQKGIDIARTHGIAAGHKRVTYPNINLAFETDNGTFSSLGEKPCAFQTSYKFNAGLLFIRRSSLTYKFIMRPWISCALTKGCIMSDREPHSICVNADKFGFCHRFDQSVLSIILNRLYHTKLAEIDLGNKVVWTKCYRRDSVVIFNEMVFKDNSDITQCPL